MWWYVPLNQIVQIDFEGDNMEVVIYGGQRFEKPSEWIKFAKDSPWEDIKDGIKGLGGALMLRALVRASTHMQNTVVVTPTGAKKISNGQQLTSRDISSNARHEFPSKFTLNLNVSGNGQGIRRTYKEVGVLTSGETAVVYVDPNMSKTLGSEFATNGNISHIFKTVFSRNPTDKDLTMFRSLNGLFRLMSHNMSKDQIQQAIRIFNKLLNEASIPSTEKDIITTKVMNSFI